MAIDIRDFDARDIAEAARFSIVGMHFDEYAKSPLIQRIYGRYFVCQELQRATQAIAAYDGDKLAGVLFAEMEGEPKRFRTPWRSLFVCLIGLVAHGEEAAYLSNNAGMLTGYRQGKQVEGELCLLAADPAMKGKGIGSLLLAELERREAGRSIYLFTDANCTWQFYEHRGFTRVGQRAVDAGVGERRAKLDCYLYTKTLGK